MSNCIACGAELEPPVRAPHTVYVKTLYRIAGQDYCRHHIIRLRRPPASSPRLSPAPVRWWPGHGERNPPSTTDPTSNDSMYVITRHQPWAS